MVAAEEVAVPVYGAVRSSIVDKQPHNSHKRIAAGVLAAGAALLLVAGFTFTSAPQQVELKGNVLQPYYSWEKQARMQMKHETQSLKANLDPQPKRKAVDMAKVSVGKSHLTTELRAKFRDRDALKQLSGGLKQVSSKQSDLQGKIDEESAKITKLQARLKDLNPKLAARKKALLAEEARADPHLRSANTLFARQQGIQQQANQVGQDAQETTAKGRAIIKNAMARRAQFIAAEKPVELAQQDANDASKRYRYDALKYANAMVRAEKVAKDPKLAAAATRKLAALRAKMNLDAAKERAAHTELENSQAGMRVTPDVTNWGGMRARGQKMLRAGVRLAVKAKELQNEAAGMQPEVSSVQAVAASAETKVHAKRVAKDKVAKEVSGIKSNMARLQQAKQRTATKLATIQKHEVELRKKGKQLHEQLSSLSHDISRREAARAKHTTQMAAENSKEMKQLLAEE